MLSISDENSHQWVPVHFHITIETANHLLLHYDIKMTSLRNLYIRKIWYSLWILDWRLQEYAEKWIKKCCVFSVRNFILYQMYTRVWVCQVINSCLLSNTKHNTRSNHHLVFMSTILYKKGKTNWVNQNWFILEWFEWMLLLKYVSNVVIRLQRKGKVAARNCFAFVGCQRFCQYRFVTLIFCTKQVGVSSQVIYIVDNRKLPMVWSVITDLVFRKHY